MAIPTISGEGDVSAVLSGPLVYVDGEEGDEGMALARGRLHH